MAPREQPSTRASSRSPTSEDCVENNFTGNSNSTGSERISSGDTQVLYTADGAPYVICSSRDAFCNPTCPNDLTAAEVNETLNLDLGQSWIRRDQQWLVSFIAFLHTILLVEWWEPLLHRLLLLSPENFRRQCMHKFWQMYLPVHRYFLHRSTGLHPSVSEEYHALTTMAWGARFFPMPVYRMRFSMSQLCLSSPQPVLSTVQRVHDTISVDGAPEVQRSYCHVSGLYLHSAVAAATTTAAANKPQNDDQPCTIFWVFGGAYLSGDTQGNASIADHVGRHTHMNVFLPNLRLAPEADMEDVLWDTALAYRWLLDKHQGDASKIILLGVSSGGAICVRLMQYIAECQRGEILLPEYMSTLVKDVPMPSAAVLFGPYVDYTQPKQGSFLHYPRHDLVVTEAVQEYGLPYLTNFCPGNQRRLYSPLHRSMEGLPPLCVIVSEHEAVYDQCIVLVNKAREAGVLVTVGVWKYLCHVFSFLWGFCPEGGVSMEFVFDWMVRQQKQKQQLVQPAHNGGAVEET